jgi:hypothetical protein
MRSESVPEAPDPFNLPKEQAAPMGRPLQENLNVLPANPERLSVVVPEEPAAAMFTVEGFAVILGVGGGEVGSFLVPGTTVTESVMVWTLLPLVANTVTGTVCAFALE